MKEYKAVRLYKTTYNILRELSYKLNIPIIKVVAQAVEHLYKRELNNELNK